MQVLGFQYLYSYCPRWMSRRHLGLIRRMMSVCPRLDKHQSGNKPRQPPRSIPCLSSTSNHAKTQGVDDIGFDCLISPSWMGLIGRIFGTCYAEVAAAGESLIWQRCLGFYHNYEGLKHDGPFLLLGRFVFLSYL